MVVVLVFGRKEEIKNSKRVRAFRENCWKMRTFLQLELEGKCPGVRFVHFFPLFWILLVLWILIGKSSELVPVQNKIKFVSLPLPSTYFSSKYLFSERFTIIIIYCWWDEFINIYKCYNI